MSPPRLATWGPDRLDVFVLGTDRALYHKWWDGSAWGPSVNGYEYLGGICMSPPEVVAWGTDRLDVFVLGTDNAVYHKWWDGSDWGPSVNGYEYLGGVCASPPRVVAWGENRLDMFVIGTDSALYHKWWDGSAWSGWEYMGGVCTTAPTVVSWGPNRLDVFVLGTDSRAVPQVVGRLRLGTVAHRLRVHGRHLHRRAAGRLVGPEPARRVRHRHRQAAVPQVVGRLGLGTIGHRVRAARRRHQRLQGRPCPEIAGHDRTGGAELSESPLRAVDAFLRGGPRRDQRLPPRRLRLPAGPWPAGGGVPPGRHLVRLGDRPRRRTRGPPGPAGWDADGRLTRSGAEQGPAASLSVDTDRLEIIWQD